MDVPFHNYVQKLMLPLLFRLPNPQLKSNAVGTSVSPADLCFTCLSVVRTRLSKVKSTSDVLIHGRQACTGWSNRC